MNVGSQGDLPAPIYSSAYTVIPVVIQYLLPLAVITAAYIGIVVYLWNEKASQRALNLQRENAARKENTQVVKAVLTIVIFFAVCQLPHQLAWLLWEFGRPKHQEIANELLKFSPITGYLHSCVNPIIYGTFMVYFRQEFKALLTTYPSCRLQPRQVLNSQNSTSASSEARQQCRDTGNDNITVNADTRGKIAEVE